MSDISYKDMLENYKKSLEFQIEGYTYRQMLQDAEYRTYSGGIPPETGWYVTVVDALNGSVHRYGMRWYDSGGWGLLCTQETADGLNLDTLSSCKLETSGVRWCKPWWTISSAEVAKSVGDGAPWISDADLQELWRRTSAASVFRRDGTNAAIRFAHRVMQQLNCHWSAREASKKAGNS